MCPGDYDNTPGGYVTIAAAESTGGRTQLPVSLAVCGEDASKGRALAGSERHTVVCAVYVELGNYLEVPSEGSSRCLFFSSCCYFSVSILIVCLSNPSFSLFISQVIAVGKTFFTNTLSVAFGDSRLKLIIDDAARYLREEGRGQNYDVIICDSSDPVGPADVLFQPEFFESMKQALNPVGGVVCTQGECQWLHLDLIAKVFGEVKGIYNQVKYAYTTIPTYPSGQIGFMIASIDKDMKITEPSREVPEDLQVRYYTDRIHKASFVLPSKSRFSLCACYSPRITIILAPV